MPVSGKKFDRAPKIPPAHILVEAAESRTSQKHRFLLVASTNEIYLRQGYFPVQLRDAALSQATVGQTLRNPRPFYPLEGKRSERVECLELLASASGH